MASLLELPIDVLPNDHSPWWYLNWQQYLRQFGLTLSPDVTAKGAIWCSHPWIASVKSLNFENGTHSILMHEGGRVLWDPSTKKRYKTGTYLLGEDVVLSGRHLDVENASELHKLKEYRDTLTKLV